MENKWLVRLFDCSNENMIAAYYTETPSESLKTFHFCKEHGIDIHIPENFKKEDCIYNDKEAGSIYEIHVGFGNEESYCYIDIWLEDVY